jgi:hypothetical protein
MWKARLRQAVRSGTSDLTVLVAGQDTECGFGCWLHGEAQSQLPPADYELICRLHADFHREAAAVLDLALAGKRTTAEAAMSARSSFARVSSRLVSELMRLQRDAA